MVDPDLQIRGGGRGEGGTGHSDPEIKGDPVSKKFFVVWSKNKGGGPLPWICHCLKYFFFVCFCVHLIIYKNLNI